MLWTIFVILLVLWLLGLVTSYTVGGFIHGSVGLGRHCSPDSAHSRAKSRLREVAQT
jgi:Family of unknown function (DUF5670)